MAKQKERVQMCTVASDAVIKTCLECLEKDCESMAIYVDYYSLRHPVVTAQLVLLPSENMPQELSELVGEVVVEFTANLNTLLRSSVLTSNVLDLISSLRIRCSTGWITYGYTSARSQYGVPYMAKTWLYIPSSRMESVPLHLSEDELKTITKLTGIAIKKAREVLESEVL
uniref:Uncharacterized protein n=1 Tax=Ignisphaera aggregans TaxID=334771 RepID=A0A7C4BD39_9CREN